jgi:polysaccharide pyruvyl transferase WcaK-like protein
MPSLELSLLHLVNGRSANVGNGALTEGAEAVLDEDLPRPVRWRREAWDDYTFGSKPFDRDFVALINGSDGLIVGGAVAINGREFYADAGMRFNLPRGLWPQIRRPVVFYGISYRHWDSQPYHHADRLRWTLDHILARDDMLLALRNDGTREWLAARFGIADPRIHVIPDAGVFLPADEDGDYPELETERRNVLLAFNDEDAAYRYGSVERRAAVLRGIVVAVERMLARWDANLVIVPHYFDDLRMVADFIDLCRPALAHQRMIATGLARIGGSRRFYGRYRRADLVISMRVHSMSPCVGLGVPMVPLVTQNRMSDFLADIGVADLQVDAFAPDMADRLSAAIDATLADPAAVRRRFAEARERMRARARAFNARVADLLAAA